MLFKTLLGGRGVAAALVFLAAPLAFSATVLFPKPLHLVRRVDDPISKTTATIDEYCLGNRVITIHGSRVAITDYASQQLTEIDHAAQTWSITPFADISKARTDLETRVGSSDAHRAGKTTAVAADGYVIAEAHRRLELGFDRHVVLSRAAAEVLIGAAYPNARSQEADDILAAAANGGGVSAMNAGANSEGAYRLLIERTLTIDSGGVTLVSHNTVIRVGDESPPADALLIENGAKRIESRSTRLARELRDIDTLPSSNAPH